MEESGGVFGRLAAIVQGENSCRDYADGGHVTVLWCWLPFAVLLITFVLQCYFASQKVTLCAEGGKRATLARVWVYLSLAVGALNLYIFYSRCSRCNPWWALLWSVAIAAAWYVVLTYSGLDCYIYHRGPPGPSATEGSTTNR
jgi:hypothetical protein